LGAPNEDELFFFDYAARTGPAWNRRFPRRLSAERKAQDALQNLNGRRRFVAAKCAQQLVTMSFNQNLKTQLLLSEMQVKELAVRTGIKKHTIDGYLRTDGCMPSALNAVKIAKALRVSVEELVSGIPVEIKKGRPFSRETLRIAQIANGLDKKNLLFALQFMEMLHKGTKTAKSALPPPSE
jgi:transcriptional regulator with XRE-family HTH domain